VALQHDKQQEEEEEGQRRGQKFPSEMQQQRQQQQQQQHEWVCLSPGVDAASAASLRRMQQHWAERRWRPENSLGLKPMLAVLSARADAPLWAVLTWQGEVEACLRYCHSKPPPQLLPLQLPLHVAGRRSNTRCYCCSEWIDAAPKDTAAAAVEGVARRRGGEWGV